MWLYGLFCALLFCSASAQSPSERDETATGFLAEAIPLEVVTTTPVALTRDASVSIRGQQALTVVFSRPVIALGSDFGFEELPPDLVPFTLEPAVPGRGRWVTTFIYRFDPDGPFATDLEIRFAWNLDLRTYDGVPLTLESPKSVTLTTRSLTMSIRHVRSAAARNATDGRWNALRGLDSDILPEIPPDGVVQLQFNAPVALDVLQESLKVVDETEETTTDIGVTVEPCLGRLKPENGESTCANVTIDGDLQMGTKYAFLLEAGVDYGEASGPLRKDRKRSFGGLRRFVIPFVEFSRPRFSTPFLDVYIPHGLAEGTEVSDIPITLTGGESGNLNFNLTQVNKAVLRIQAPILPGNRYTIVVEASENVLDGFGLPLESSSIRFHADQVSSYLEKLESGNFPPYGVFEADQDWGREVFTLSKGTARRDSGTCRQHPSVDLWSIFEPERAIPLLRGSSRNSFRSRLGQPDDELVPLRDDEIGQLTSKDVTPLLSASGVIAYQLCRYGSFTPEIFAETTVQATVVTHGQQGSNQQLRVWVTSMETGAPVEAADVMLYTNPFEQSPRLVGEGRTNEDGIAYVNNNNNSDGSNLVAVIKIGANFIYIPNVYISGVSVQFIEDSIILDRALVRPGETLHVKGYVMQRDGSTFAPARGLGNTRLTVSPELAGMTAFPVELSEEFGSYEATIVVPEDATLQPYFLRFTANRSPSGQGNRNQRYSGSSERFTVGDPRLPTVELTVDTPFWVSPTGEIEIQVNLESFIGSAVGGIEVTVEWKVRDSDRDDDEEPLEGELTITTDDNGNGTAIIDLSEWEVPPTIGITVSLEFQLVGPTSELIEDSATVRIEAADVDLTISRTVATDVPGQKFGVAAEVTDLRGGRLKGKRKIETATIRLVQLDDDLEQNPPSTGLEPLEGTVSESCVYNFDKEDYCEFELTSAGNFAIEVCVEDGDVTVCERVYLGETLEEWTSDPLEAFLPIGFTDLTPGTLELGKNKEILVENPYSNAYALISWGTVESFEEKLMPLAPERSTIKVEVTELCEYRCGLSVVVAVPRQTDGLATNITIPVSKLFDPAMPHTETYTSTIQAERTTPSEIDVAISFPEADEDEGTAVVGPGSNTTVEIELSSEERTEVTVIAVDKAVLELMPYALVDLPGDFSIDLSTTFEHRVLSRNLISPAAIEALIMHFEDRKALNPWFSLVNELSSNYRVDRPEDEYIDSISDFITIQPSAEFYYAAYAYAPTAESTVTPKTAARSTSFRAAASTEAAALSADVEEGDVEAEGESGGSLRLESDFVTTPLFETFVAEGGTLQATFEAPVNLGTFVIRAYASSAAGLFGGAESEIIVRRDLSLTPSVPRFVRTSDTFEAGAVVTVSGNVSVVITLSVEIDGPLQLTGADSMEVDVGADGQEEARFEFVALSVGTANLTFTATDDAGNSDALQVEIEIEGIQEAVTVGTSFTVEGADTMSFVEGIDLPEAVPGSGSILVTAGVGREPAVMALADQILDVKEPLECPVSGDFGLASISIPAIVNPYDPWNPEPGSVSGETAKLINLILADFEAAVPLMARGGGLTSQREGLRVSLPCPRYDFDREPSFYQNAKGVFLFGLIEEQLLNHDLPEVQAAADTLMAARELWRSVLSDVLVQAAIESRNQPEPGPLSLWMVAFGRAALGADWLPSTDDPVIVNDLSMRRLSEAFADMSVESQAYYILARLAEPQGIDHRDISLAMDTWTNLLRITGRTAYIAAFKGAAAPASDLANSLVFLAMLRAGQEDQLLPRLGSYIASPPADNYGFRFFATYPKLVTMHALVEFDESRGSAQPDLEFEAVSGNTTLLSASFTNASAIASSRTPWETLPEDPAPIEVSAVGSGEASVAVTLNFVPAELLRFPTYRGIFVERSIQLEDAEDGDGPGVSVVPRGSVVTVKVQFLTPDALDETIVRVLMPAGLEPVDPNIADDPQFCPVPFFSLYRSFFFQCPLQETRPSVVTFTFNSVRPGTTSVTFRAVAATVGHYTLPPTRVFASEQPEVMGLSSAGDFRVCAGEGCDITFLEVPAPPIACPDDCSGSGSCNLRDGTCLCFPNFTGPSCDQPIDS